MAQAQEDRRDSASHPTTKEREWFEGRKSIGAQILLDVDKQNVSHHVYNARSYESHFIMGTWTNIPPGLEILREYQSIQVRQQRDNKSGSVLKDVEMTGYNRRNSYDIFDESQRRILHVSEYTDLEHMRKGKKRKYTFSVRGPDGNEVFKVQRIQTCCGDGIECSVGGGQVVGGVKAGCSCFFCTAYYDVFAGKIGRHQGPNVLLIEDRGWCNREFAVVDPVDRSQVLAYITKRFEDASMEGFDDADVFLLDFKGRHEMHPVHKTILIGAVFFLVRFTHLLRLTASERSGPILEGTLALKSFGAQ